jgi:hypothetical protein
MGQMRQSQPVQTRLSGPKGNRHSGVTLDRFEQTTVDEKPAPGWEDVAAMSVNVQSVISVAAESG